MTSSRVETTRERILAILRRSDGATIDQLATAVGLAGATVRRHLDVLLRDGHVTIQQAKGRTGRPRYVFFLTEAGADLFPHHYVRLTHRLLDEILSLDTRETEGRDGRALAGLVFERMADHLALEYGPRLRNGTLLDRARRAAALLAEEGIDFEVVPAPAGAPTTGVPAPAGAPTTGVPAPAGAPTTGVPAPAGAPTADVPASAGAQGTGARNGGSANANGARSTTALLPDGSVHLVGRGCPCLGLGPHATTSARGTPTDAARAAPAGCEHDRRLLQRLLGVQVSILPAAALPGDSLAGYRLDPTPATPAAPLVPLA